MDRVVASPKDGLWNGAALVAADADERRAKRIADLFIFNVFCQSLLR